jgi:hypothetical protein
MNSSLKEHVKLAAIYDFYIQESYIIVNSYHAL